MDETVADMPQWSDFTLYTENGTFIDSFVPVDSSAKYDINAVELVATNFGPPGEPYSPVVVRRTFARNALGLARLSDLPPLTNNISTLLSSACTALSNYTDSAISSADTTYKSFALAVPTNVNQSVQFLNIEDPTPSTIDIPLPAGGGTKDWIIYIYAATNVTLRLPEATWWLADTSATNDIAPQTPTALYFSPAADNIYTLGRQEFTEVVLP